MPASQTHLALSDTDSAHPAPYHGPVTRASHLLQQQQQQKKKNKNKLIKQEQHEELEERHSSPQGNPQQQQQRQRRRQQQQQRQKQQQQRQRLRRPSQRHQDHQKQQKREQQQERQQQQQQQQNDCYEKQRLQPYRHCNQSPRTLRKRQRQHENGQQEQGLEQETEKQNRQRRKEHGHKQEEEEQQQRQRQQEIQLQQQQQQQLQQQQQQQQYRQPSQRRQRLKQAEKTGKETELVATTSTTVRCSSPGHLNHPMNEEKRRKMNREEDEEDEEEEEEEEEEDEEVEEKEEEEEGDSQHQKDEEKNGEDEHLCAGPTVKEQNQACHQNLPDASFLKSKTTTPLATRTLTASRQKRTSNRVATSDQTSMVGLQASVASTDSAKRLHSPPLSDGHQIRTRSLKGMSERGTLSCPKLVWTSEPWTPGCGEKPWVTCMLNVEGENVLMADPVNRLVRMMDMAKPEQGAKTMTLHHAPFRLALLSDGLVAVTTAEFIIYLLEVETDLEIAIHISTVRKYIGVAGHPYQGSLLIVGCGPTENDRAHIDVINRDGEILQTIDNSGPVLRRVQTPCNVYHPTGSSFFFVSDTARNEVHVVDVLTGSVMATARHPRMDGPQQVCADQEGRLYVACSESHCVLVRMTAGGGGGGGGGWTQALRARDHSQGDYRRPVALCLTRSGRLAVSWGQRIFDCIITLYEFQ